MKIAVIGSGITGLSAAWLLSRAHEVTLFEKGGHFGGHSDTASVREGDREVPIDTGFIVYNVAAYPNLVALFDYLEVPTHETLMSFSVSLQDGGYEYCGNGFSGLFAQRRNLFSLDHWRMARDILRFFKEAEALDVSALDENLSLGEWLGANGYGESFVRRHILPMGAAIWSAPAEKILAFPVGSFARFFKNHGLLVADVDKRPPWRTVDGGSREYVQRILAQFQGRKVLGVGAASIRRDAAGVEVTLSDGSQERFDRCLVAAHADDALNLLSDADDLERSLLGAWNYSRNEAVLHTDARLMPRLRRVWSSWNYTGADSDRVAVTYWMNALQPLRIDQDYFVSLNASREIAEDKVIKRMTYHHPVFDRESMGSQRDLWTLQGRRNTWFAGSYFGYGFHEDGLQSGLAAAEEMGAVRRPWSVAGERSRVLALAERDAPDMRMAAE